MQPHSAGRPRDDTTAREHLAANVDAAGRASLAGGADPGHWQMHHIALPAGGPGDFTPYRAPDYAEEQHLVHEPLLEVLAGLFGVDHVSALRHRGLEAGQ